MNYAIDPEVFSAAFFDNRCEWSLAKLLAELNLHRFYRDEESVIEREYRQLFVKYFHDHEEHSAILLLQHMLSDDGYPEDTVSSDHKSLKKILKEKGCVEPVEPELIGMISNSKDIGLILILIGKRIGKTRSRGLYRDEVFRTIGKKIPWLEVCWAGDSSIRVPQTQFQDSEHSHQKSHEFELKAALWLQDSRPELRCVTPPSKGDIDGEQIDVYGRQYIEDEVTIVVGECKLRREGNEDKSITRKEIQQLRRKVLAAKKYEEGRQKGSEIRLEGLLITNATGLEEEALDLLKEETLFKLQILKVVLTRRWETRQDWRILDAQKLWDEFR